jgi:hypothetical protein
MGGVTPEYKAICAKCGDLIRFDSDWLVQLGIEGKDPVIKFYCEQCALEQESQNPISLN